MLELALSASIAARDMFSRRAPGGGTTICLLVKNQLSTQVYRRAYAV